MTDIFYDTSMFFSKYKYCLKMVIVLLPIGCHRSQHCDDHFWRDRMRQDNDGPAVHLELPQGATLGRQDNRHSTSKDRGDERRRSCCQVDGRQVILCFIGNVF